MNFFGTKTFSTGFANLALIVSPKASRSMTRLPSLPKEVEAYGNKYVFNRATGFYMFDPQKEPDLGWYEEFSSIKPGSVAGDGLVIVSVMLLDSRGQVLHSSSVSRQR